MATKRTHAESEGVHESRQAQVYDAYSRRPKKQRRIEPQAPRKQIHASSVNAVKKSIRDVSRRLQRSQNLPADVRMESERALAAYQQELAAADQEKTRQKMIRKYHMVRFFERQKASRLLKKLKKKLVQAGSVEEVAGIKTQMHIAEVDLNYTQYFPLSEKYVSLYPQKSSIDDEVNNDPKGLEAPPQKPEMWAEVEKRMKDGTLNELRNRVSSVAVIRSEKKKSLPLDAKARVQKPMSDVKKAGVHGKELEVFENRRTRRKKAKELNGAAKALEAPQRAPDGVEEGSDEVMSDGGFFEE